MIQKYDIKTKIELLKKFDWSVVEGFKFTNYEPNEEVVISLSEVFKKIKEGIQIFCMESGSDYFLELSEAWKVFIDFISYELETEDEATIIKYLDQFVTKKKVEATIINNLDNLLQKQKKI